MRPCSACAAFVAPLALLSITGCRPRTEISHIGSDAPQYGVRDLGPVVAADINNRDQIVGHHRAGVFPNSNNFPYFHGFLWQNGVTTDLATFGGRYSEGSRIDGQGRILGGASVPGRDKIGLPIMHACLWQDGHMTDLTTLPGCHVNETCGFDSRGGVYLTATTQRSPGVQHVYLYNHGALRDLGILSGRKAVAKSANSHGQIVGTYETGQADSPPGGKAVPITHAFLWQGGKLRDLGVPQGYVLSEATGINERGQVIGSATDRSGVRMRVHAFLWQNGRFQDMGTLGGWISEPYAINNKGQVVGFSDTGRGEFESHGFLWENGRMRDLALLIPKHSHWLNLDGGSGINDRGQIVGDGVTNEPPEPSGNRYVHSYLLTPK